MTARLPDYDKLALLLPMDGANNGTVFTDWGPAARTVTRVGSPVTVTAQSKYYGSSGSFNGSNQALTLANNAAFRFGAEDFTVEAWVRVPSVSIRYLIACFYWSTNNRRCWQMELSASGSLVMVLSTAGTDFTSLGAAHGMSINTWHHVACTRAGDTVRLFRDGEQLGAGQTFSGALFNNTTDPLIVGALQNNTGASAFSTWFSGHMQDLCITKGLAKYTGNFTPPGRLVGEISGTIYDQTGDPADRRIVAFPRAVPTRVFETTSDDTTGAYSVRVPATECSRIVLAEDAGSPGAGDPVLPDLIHRVIPQ